MSDKDFKVKHGLSVADNIGVGTDSPSVSLDMSGRVDAIWLPSGNTASRPSGSNGMIRYNTTIGEFEGYSNSSGGWSILTLAGSSLDADFLGSQLPSYYLDLANATGNLPAGHFTNTSHGALGNGSLHAVANTTVNGFFSSTDKVLLDAIPAGANIFRAYGTLGTSDLNSVTTTGWYYQDTGANGSLANHYPVVNSAGALEVLNHNSGTFVYQKFHFYGGVNQGQVYYRAFYSGTWYAWRRMFDDLNLTQSTLNTLLGNANTIIVGTGALNSGSITNGFGNIDIGTSVYTGNGSSITSLNATQLLTGTIPNGRFPATLPTANGANLTDLTAGALIGTIPDANMPYWTRGTSSATDTSTDLNNISNAGWYSNLVGPTNTNIPAAGTFFIMNMSQGTNPNITQYAFPRLTDASDTTSSIWYRNRIGVLPGAWTAWQRVLKANEYGTVAFNAALTGTTGTFSGTLTSSQNFVSSTTTALLAATGTGQIILRPNGVAVSTNQAVLNTSGDLTLAGALAAGGAISGTTGTFTGAMGGTSATFSGLVSALNFASAGFYSTTSIVILAATGTGSVFIRPNGIANSTVGQTTFNSNGTITLQGGVIGTTGTFSSAVSGTTGTFSGAVSGTTGTFNGAVQSSQNFVGASATAVLATTTAGNVFLRPNGAGSTTGQAQLSSIGDLSLVGALVAGGAVSGTTGTFSGAVSGTTGAFSGNLTTNGQLSITSTGPYFRLTDSDSTGNSMIGYMEWRDSAATQLAYIGKVGNNAVMTFSNLMTGSNFLFQGESAATIAQLSKATGLLVSNVMNSGVSGVTAQAGSGAAAGVVGTSNNGSFIGRLGYNDLYAFHGTGPIYATSNLLTDQRVYANTGSNSAPSFAFNGGTNCGMLLTAGLDVAFSVVGFETARLSSTGLMVGVTQLINPGNAEYGWSAGKNGLMVASASGSQCFRFKRDADGTLGEFYSGTTSQGSISISGTTVTYGSFCGVHESQLVDGKKKELLRGTILESVDEMAEWYAVEYVDIDGNTIRDEEMAAGLSVGKSVKVEYQRKVEIAGEVVTNTHKAKGKVVILANDQLPKYKVSDTPKSKAVYGVFMTWDEDYLTTNDTKVASLGAYVVRIGKSIVVNRGDYIESAGDGTGRVQEDDILRSRTVAKVTSNKVIETFEDGSYLVPCTLHCG